MARLDIDQLRAKYAFTNAGIGMSEAGKKYGSQIESLPMMIHNAGLRNTLAFAYAKGYLKDNKEWQLVLDHIINWFAKEEPTKFFGTTFKEQKEDKQVAEANIKAFIEIKDDYLYRFATQETIALVNWLRKLVKGDN